MNTNPGDTQSSTADADIAAALREVRLITAQTKISEHWWTSNPNIQIDAFERISDNTASMLCNIWDVATKRERPEVMIETALDFCQHFVQKLLALRDAAYLSEFADQKTVDRISVRTAQWLNEWAIWKLLAYRDLGSEWIEARRNLLAPEADRTEDAFDSLQPGNPCSEIGAPVVASMLLEHCACHSLSRPEIANLIEGIWLISECVPLRLEPLGIAELFIDAHTGNGQQRINSTNMESSHRLGGWCVCPEDISEAIDRTFNNGARMAPGGSVAATLVKTQLKHRWSAHLIKRGEDRKRASATPVAITFGYHAVLGHMTGRTMYVRNSFPNAALTNISSRGCCLVMAKSLAEAAAIPGRLIAISGGDNSQTSICGTVDWIRAFDHTPNQVSIGICFFSGQQSAAVFRSDLAFPSGLKIEKLLRLEDPSQHTGENDRPRVICTKGTYREHLELAETTTGFGYLASRIVAQGVDYELIELVPKYTATVVGLRVDSAQATTGANREALAA